MISIYCNFFASCFWIGITYANAKGEDTQKPQEGRKGELAMSARKQTLKVGVMGAVMTLLATPAFARSIELKGAGTALWVFLILGSIIVLLQLIPAIILFFSFVGSVSTTVLRKERKIEEGMVLPGSEPAAVRR